jgi:hypothetical protein
VEALVEVEALMWVRREAVAWGDNVGAILRPARCLDRWSNVRTRL